MKIPIKRPGAGVSKLNEKAAVSLSEQLREKQMKEWKRAWKVRLIEQMNPEWKDLFDEATGEVSLGPADIERERS